jgi:[acyl-carrier-protein] S-malonyltransferase
MGRAWVQKCPESAAAFAEADAALRAELGVELSRLCWEGPESDLQLTANTQPAILATSVAILRAVEARGLRAACVAGHSLGEYSALVAAGALGFGDALRLVRRRGVLMQQAVPAGVGAMAAILGLESDAVAALAAQASAAGEICAVANFNAPEQTVVSGHAPAVERAIDLARQRGARRAVALPVSAPFHSPLMAPARQGLLPALAAVRLADPRVPVVCNIDAQPVSTGEAARDALARQVDGPVRWVESVRWMAGPGGISTFVEVGPGNVLVGLIRRISPGARCVSLAEPAGLAELEA